MSRKIMGLLLVMALQLGSATLLHAVEPADANRTIARESADTSGDDEYNFSWLDPDKKVYVLQNRKYRKKNRLALFASGGFNINNPYKSEMSFIPRASYWFTEQWGLEFFYASVSNKDNDTLKGLKQMSNALPFIRQFQSYYGGLVTWTPWYSKLNFFNKILYFDWFFDAGLGQISSQVDQNLKVGGTPNFLNETLTAFAWGTGMDFYVTRNFLVRLDLIALTYSANGADNATKHTFTNYDFAAGVGYAF
jgi:outer membrane beta-barrel protein